jgi:hypothetical protein
MTLAAAGAVAGSPREITDTLLRRRDRLGLSYVTVPNASAEAFAPWSNCWPPTDQPTSASDKSFRPVRIGILMRISGP